MLAQQDPRSGNPIRPAADAMLIMLVSSQHGGNDTTEAKECDDENNVEYRIIYE